MLRSSRKHLQRLRTGQGIHESAIVDVLEAGMRRVGRRLAPVPVQEHLQEEIHLLVHLVQLKEIRPQPKKDDKSTCLSMTHTLWTRGTFVSALSEFFPTRVSSLKAPVFCQWPTHLTWRLLTLDCRSTCPAEYCSITSFTSYGFKASLNFLLANKS